MSDDDVHPGDVAHADQVRSQMRASRRQRGGKDAPIEVGVRFALIEGESMDLLASALVHIGQSILAGVEDGRDVPVMGNTLSVSYFLGGDGSPFPVTFEIHYLTDSEIAEHNAAGSVRPGDPMPPPPTFTTRPWSLLGPRK